MAIERQQPGEWIGVEIVREGSEEIGGERMDVEGERAGGERWPSPAGKVVQPKARATARKTAPRWG